MKRVVYTVLYRMPHITFTVLVQLRLDFYSTTFATSYTHFLDEVGGNIREVVVSDDGGVGLRAVEFLEDGD